MRMCLGFDVDSKVKLRCTWIDTGLRNPYGVGHLLQGHLKFGSISLPQTLIFNPHYAMLKQSSLLIISRTQSVITINHSWESSDVFFNPFFEGYQKLLKG